MSAFLKYFFLIIVLLFIYTYGSEKIFDSCGISQEQAVEKILRELTEDSKAIDHLTLQSNRGTCEYSFMYNGPLGKIDYIILSTWQHGVKIMWWDYGRDNSP
jgi:hypothetical protein